jgi:hypothetical protein
VRSPASEARNHDSSHGDRGHVRVSTELGNEAAARLERARDGGEDRVGVSHPVQDGVREHRVEFALERQSTRVRHAGVDSLPHGLGDHLGGGVDSDHRGARCDDPRREGSVAAAQIKDPLAGPCGEMREQRRTERWYERGVLPVVGRGPRLRHPHMMAYTPAPPGTREILRRP